MSPPIILLPFVRDARACVSHRSIRDGGFLHVVLPVEECGFVSGNITKLTVCCTSVRREGRSSLGWCIRTAFAPFRPGDSRVYRYRFSVIPFASFSCAAAPKKSRNAHRFQESLSVTCRDYGLRRKIVPRLCSSFICGFYREHEIDRPAY